MLERIYKYRVTCDGKCRTVIEYETEEKKSLPKGWVGSGANGFTYAEPQCFCAACYAEFHEHGIGRDPSAWDYRNHPQP